MTDPFTVWSRMVAACIDTQLTWIKGAETLRASQSVIGARTDKMRDAARSPIDADYAEFARMVPEKIDAFSQSARAVTGEIMAMHGAWLIQMQRVGLMMLSGRLPTIAEAGTLAAQSADYALGAMSATARLGKDALAPVHRAATGNARRLNRAKTR